jgi:hypothetical protein
MPDYVAAQLCQGSEFLAYDNPAYLPLTRIAASSFLFVVWISAPRIMVVALISLT